MKCLSVWQPWAWLIIHAPAPNGPKDVENRTWYTDYRGPLLICASQRRDWKEYWRADRCARERGITLPGWYALSYGNAIGIIDLVDCVRNYPSKWAEPDLWHWILANPRSVKPFFVRGYQKLFEVEAQVV